MKYFIVLLPILFAVVIKASDNYLGIFNNPNCGTFLAELKEDHFSVEFFKQTHPDFDLAQSNPNLDRELTSRAKRLLFLKTTLDSARQNENRMFEIDVNGISDPIPLMLKGIKSTLIESDWRLLQLVSVMRKELAEYRFNVSKSLAILPLDREISKQPRECLNRAILPIKEGFDAPIKKNDSLKEQFETSAMQWTDDELIQKATSYAADDSIPVWMQHDLRDHLDFMKKYSIPVDLTFRYFVATIMAILARDLKR